MIRRKDLFLLFLLLILLFPALARDNSVYNFGNDTIKMQVSQDETILFNMINDLRRQSKLPAIPLSLDLCKVAHVHISDLIASRPQENGCSLHSWSGSGNWTACCNSKDPSGIQCMKLKPREITGYPGFGFELIYWGEDNATPSDAAGLWQQTDASADMILSRGKWKSYQWKALGVGIKDGYAILWLGDKAEKKSEITTVKKSLVVENAADAKGIAAQKPVEEEKNSNAKADVPSNKSALNEVKPDQSVVESGTKYYLIVSSVKTAESAKSELKRFKSKGYTDAVILEGGSVYRISLKSFESLKKAKTELNKFKNVFPEIWVFKK